jgi:hypothetical protein
VCIIHYPNRTHFWIWISFHLCPTGDMAHTDAIFKFLPYTCQHGCTNILSMHPFWCVCGKNLNIVSMCAVSPMVHTSYISSCQKKLFKFSCGCGQFYWGRSSDFLVINVCNHRYHYEMPCIVTQHAY